MDYSKKNNDVFDDERAKKQLQAAFKKDEPTDTLVKGAFQLPKTRKYERKIQTTYTLTPAIKAGIDALAAEQGYRSASAFVDELFDQVLKQVNN
ncbi:hypothetical protein [Leuconostoc citreum]|uniref:hypothetical protein n=1 Tax=Leuconostoc citreum TaxID=33964 RepID=UPI0032DEF632